MCYAYAYMYFVWLLAFSIFSLHLHFYDVLCFLFIQFVGNPKMYIDTKSNDLHRKRKIQQNNNKATINNNNNTFDSTKNVHKRSCDWVCLPMYMCMCLKCVSQWYSITISFYLWKEIGKSSLHQPIKLIIND